MSNYLTRKKALMGRNYEITVALEQYGNAEVRLHAVPDMELARIEDRTGYKLETAINTLNELKLTEDEIKALKENTASPELIEKGAKALDPKLVLFLGELLKASMVPDPDCPCKGKGCPECDVVPIVEDLRGFSLLQLGMATIGASTASWEEIESFFSQKRGPSGAGSSA